MWNVPKSKSSSKLDSGSEKAKMCEINPKRKKLFKLEVFTAHEVSDEKWNHLVYDAITLIEQFLNRRGEIRVHIHEDDDSNLQGVRIDTIKP
jgi:hypothetical protein